MEKYKWKPRRPVRRNQCKAHGCWNPVWKGGYCYRHQYFVQAKLPIPKFKKKKVSKTHVFGFTTLPELFQHCYYTAKQPIICPVSGEDITNLFRQDFDVWKCCCAHVLNRSKWPLFRLFPGNIVLLLPRAHSLYDQGTESQRQAMVGYNWQYLYDLKDKLKLQYDNYRKYGQTEAPVDEAELHPTDKIGTPAGTQGDQRDDADTA